MVEKKNVSAILVRTKIGRFHHQIATRPLINSSNALRITSFTLILYKDEAEAEAAEPEVKGNGGVHAPLTGKLVDITEVPDEVFAGKMLGDGMAIIPEVGELYAPADGTVDTVFDSKHAISMVCDNGAEILMHVGLDTVKLEGKFFEPQVENGQKVKAGQLLMKFDVANIRKAGYNVITPVVVTNHEDCKIEKDCPGSVITLTKGRMTIKATQLMMLMCLGVKRGDTVTIAAEGGNETASLAAIQTFFQENL